MYVMFASFTLRVTCERAHALGLRVTCVCLRYVLLAYAYVTCCVRTFTLLLCAHVTGVPMFCFRLGTQNVLPQILENGLEGAKF